eukprot:600707-Prymnesium_polylepis.1
MTLECYGSRCGLARYITIESASRDSNALKSQGEGAGKPAFLDVLHAQRERAPPRSGHGRQNTGTKCSVYGPN